MAIVLKYGAPGPILQSGFASGVGHQQHAQQDDLLKIWQQQQYQGFQADQAALHRQQQADLQQNAQKFQADQGQLDRNLRQEQDLLHRGFQAGQTERNRQQVQKHYDDLLYQGTQKALANGEKALPPSAQSELNKLEEGRVLLQGPGWTDEQRAQFQKDYQERKRALTMLAEPVTSPAAAANRDTVYRDKTGKAYDQPIEGVTKPYSVSSGKQIEDSQDQADRKTAAEQQKKQEAAQAQQQKRQQAAQKQFQTDTKEYGKTLHAEMVRRQKAEQDPVELTMKPLESYAEAARSGLSAAGIVPPQQSQQASDQPVQGQPVTGQWGDGQHGEPVAQPPVQAAPKSQDQILNDFTKKNELGQLKQDLPEPTKEQLAAPFMGTRAQLENLPHGSVVGPIAGPDGNQHLYQWNSQAKKLVRIGQWNGETPDRGPQKRVQPEPEFAAPMY